MTKGIRLLFVLTSLFLAALACAFPPAGNPPAAPANVETIVAETFAALTGTAPEISATPPASQPTVGLLPHSMYFLNNDGAGLAQVYRLETDGKTVTQLTFEPAKVEGYDV